MNFLTGHLGPKDAAGDLTSAVAPLWMIRHPLHENLFKKEDE
jgi:hypothetical protein